MYRRFNAQGRQLTVRLLSLAERQESNPMYHFLDSVTELFDYALQYVEDSDMVVITITNEVEVKDRAIGIIFRRRDQITRDVIWWIQLCTATRQQPDHARTSLQPSDGNVRLSTRS